MKCSECGAAGYLAGDKCPTCGGILLPESEAESERLEKLKAEVSADMKQARRRYSSSSGGTGWLIGAVFFGLNTLYGVVKIIGAISDVASAGASAAKIEHAGLFGMGATGLILQPVIITLVMGSLAFACWRKYD